MARKSRKAAAVVTAPEIDVTCHAAVYVRLSVESKYSHSESISLKGSYETKIEQLAAEIGQLESGVAAIDRQIEEYRTLEKDAEDIRKNRELTAELIDRLIDRIEVSKDKKLTVRFKFRSEFESCEEVLEQCRNMK